MWASFDLATLLLGRKILKSLENPEHASLKVLKSIKTSKTF